MKADPVHVLVAAEARAKKHATKQAALNDEVSGSHAFRQLGRDLDAVSGLESEEAVVERMTDMVEIALHRNYVTAGLEHRRGFAKALAEQMRRDVGGDQVKLAEPSTANARGIQHALEILDAYFNQMLAISTVLHERVERLCTDLEHPPLTELHLSQVLNDMLSSTKVQSDIAALLNGRV